MKISGQVALALIKTVKIADVLGPCIFDLNFLVDHVIKTLGEPVGELLRRGEKPHVAIGVELARV